MKQLLCFLALASTALAQTPGGLSSYPAAVPSSNLLSNPGLESGDFTGWTGGGGAITVASDYAHTGTYSAKMVLSGSVVNLQQTISTQPAGVYDLSVWVKTSSITGNGVRVSVFAPPSFPYALIWTSSPALTGTNDWTEILLPGLSLGSAAQIQVSLEAAYNGTSGTAWFDDVVLTQEQRPISVFMQYPNWKGMLFDDQSQITTFSVVPNPSQGMYPTDLTLSDYTVDGTIKTADGTTVLAGSWPALASTTATFDMAALSESTEYRVSFQLTQTSSGGNASSNNQYPYYSIYKYPGSTRTGFQTSADQNQRILKNGVPTFMLGLYDSGGGYSTSESFFLNQLNSTIELSGLTGVNLYLNYWMGDLANLAASPFIAALQTYGSGVGWIETDNCVTTSIPGSSFFWYIGSDAEIEARAAMPGFWGIYRTDECAASVAATTFATKARTDRLAPGAAILGAQLGDSSLPLWRDTVDILATDPYPLFGAEGSGYPLNEVSTWTTAAMSAVQSSRPVMTVIQYFQFTGTIRWPTQAELRDMSYMAVADGANGLMYWSAGQLSSIFTELGGITSVTPGSPTTIISPWHPQCGGTCSATITGATGDWTALNGAQTITATSSSSNITVPVNSTGFAGTFNGHLVFGTGTPVDDTNAALDTVTKGAVTTFTIPGHGLTADFSYVYTYGATGSWSAMNDQSYRPTVIDANTFTIPVNSSAFSGSFDGTVRSLQNATWIANWTNLKNVIGEIDGLATPLAALDDNTKLTSNDTATVHTRVKSGATPTLIASNTTSGTVAPTFTWHAPISTVTVYNESRTITPSGSTFTDSFGAYGAHVYQITEGAGASPIKQCILCKGVKVQ